MRRLGYTLRLIAFIIPLSTYGQDATMSKKAREIYANAQKAWQDRKLPEAVALFEKVLQQDPNSYDTYLRLAQIYELQRNADLTRRYYSKVVQLKPDAP